MNGVTFDYVHSDTFGLILTNAEISPPPVKTSTIDVPGADGILDLTEALTGTVQYGNRELKLTFETTTGVWADLLSDISGELHGQRKSIVFDDDPEWVYRGRCTIDSFKTSRRHHTIVILCDCDPWKYFHAETAVAQSIDTTEGVIITLRSFRRPVCPKISTTADVTIAWDGGSASLSAGNDWIIPELVLKEGSTDLTCTGTTTLTFKYRQGKL